MVSTAPSPDMQDALDQATRVIEAMGCTSQGCVLEADASGIVVNHRIVMNHEAALAHKPLIVNQRLDLLKPKFRAALLAGSSISTDQVDEAAQVLAAAKAGFWNSLSSVDLIVTLPVPDAAPLIGGTTGFQDWLTPWTVFGGPLLCLPWGIDRLGRPLSIMLAMHPGKDAELLAFAQQLEKRAPALPRPTLPAETFSPKVE